MGKPLTRGSEDNNEKERASERGRERQRDRDNGLRGAVSVISERFVTKIELSHALSLSLSLCCLLAGGLGANLPA